MKRPTDHLNVKELSYCLLAICLLLMFFTAYSLGRPVNTLPDKIRGPKIAIEMKGGMNVLLSSETLTAAIYVNSGYVIPSNPSSYPEDPRIVLALYDDGTLIWSDNRIDGQAPYHKISIPSDKVTKIMMEFAAEGLFKKPSLSIPHTTIDLPYTYIFLKGKDSYIYMRSDHKIQEYHFPDVVGGYYGYRILGKGESRAAAIAEETTEYQEFRASWSQVERKLFELIPSKITGQASTVSLRTGYFFIHSTQ